MDADDTCTGERRYEAMGRTRPHSDVPDQLYRAMRRLGVDVDAPVLVAVSGGGDSVSAAAALYAAGYRHMTLGWINHNLRGTSAAEAERDAVRRTAARLSVPWIVREAAPGRIAEVARRDRQSVEHVARGVRYGLLTEAARTLSPPARFLVTAHHQDDAAETVLMRILGGHRATEQVGIPNARQLSGPGSAVSVVRPAMALTGEVLRAWGRSAGLTWVEDASNRDTRFRRNAVRREIVPVLRRAHPNAGAVVARFGASVDALREAVSALIPRDAWGTAHHGAESRWSVSLDALVPLPPAAQEIVLREALYAVDPSDRAAGGIVGEALRRLGRYGTAARFRIQSPRAGIAVAADHTRLEISRDVVPEGQSGYLWPVPIGTSVTVLETARGMEPTDNVDDEEDGRVNVRSAVLCPCTAPVVVRGPVHGDVIVTKGGAKRVHDPNLRDGRRVSPSVVEDRCGIVAVVGPRGVVALRDDVIPLPDEAETPVNENYVIIRVRG